MNEKRFNRWLFGLAGFFVAAALVVLAFPLLRVQAAWAGGSPPQTVIVLPLEQRVVDTAWRCESGQPCQPWFLTQTRVDGNPAPREFLLTGDDGTNFLVKETRQVSDREIRDIDIIQLPQGKKLVAMNWRCEPRRPCRLTYLLRKRGRYEPPQSYTFTDTRDTYTIFETP